MIPIISIIVAAVCLALFIVKDGKCLSLKEEVDSLKKQLAGASEPSVNDDDRPLDKEAAMDAIRYNGFVPDTDGNWITFIVQGERYVIDPDRFPVMIMMKHYGLDRNEYDMDAMHKAAHLVSDELIIGKVIFTGEQEDGLAFQVAAIENKYGHFKDSFARYLNIIEDSQARMSYHYNNLISGSEEGPAISPKQGAGTSEGKKMMS